jgi:4-diphosphocytidyl-2-C-methyl-D-erythritol kinase
MFPPFLEEAPAKINLALHVLGRRGDGYHELDSIVAFADITDTLLFEPAATTALVVRGPMGAGLPPGGDNLVLRALSEVGKHVKLPEMHITLNKNLPAAAGIGGGSADAAATLRGALRASGSQLSPDKLSDIALAIGADVPVCLRRQSCRMKGIGDVIAPLAPPGGAIVLVHPRVACDTAAVFAALGLAPGQEHREGLDPAEPLAWRNDLTEAATRVRPVIAEVLAALKAVSGFHAVRMSGSGATCFGLTGDLSQATAAAAALAKAHPQWWVRAARLN